ncbi:haloacid dehalogenase-like hydrolase [Candidatus Uabimicrobium amorphum]|uniref:Phosphorylcholine phosphatase n=1 Tax=Uabimicrobium amorphum TaxID=2596890 RepID=A0A5S9F6I0_UABAM|nr:haloacid dehalogenase-like hydrolase [Candidatus Uabimicrobium amorphum]BBM87907.1 phosphorylcholine phosphatase [Candidatus Uabimicrobium amorphum]
MPAKIYITLLLCFFTINIYADKAVSLEPHSWCPVVKEQLEKLIADNAHKNKKVVFDFDNTMICRDIGEAMFVTMAMDQKLQLHRDLHPSFVFAGKKHGAAYTKDIVTYYENYLAMSKDMDDETPYANGYAWLAQVMRGISPGEVVTYTQKAFAGNIARHDQEKNTQTTIRGYRRPFFYPEMVDLAGRLLYNGYDVYVISASNIWTVRWMVTKKLNKRIQKKFGKHLGIAADHVIGVSVLLKDRRDNKLYKDAYLVKNNNAYAAMNAEELENYTLTPEITYPLTGYFGKVANIFKYVSQRRPFLVCGDSPNDFPMLNWGQNRLFITRLEKIDYQKKLVEQINKSLPGKWLLQPTLYKKSPGFVSSRREIELRLKGNRYKRVVDLLEKSQYLRGFSKK